MQISGERQTPIRQYTHKFYVNEFLLGDSSSLAILNDSKVVYINHSVFKHHHDQGSGFTEYIYQHAKNTIGKGTLMSYVRGKERRNFFNGKREAIESRIKTI